MLSAIVGINWGDEGKGRMVDLLSERYDIVIRYQGGNNAGHTVVNERGKFILNLLPSGILRESTVNVMGCGMVVDIKHLYEEMGRLVRTGITITPDHLKISDKAIICMPYHKQLDILEEDRLAKFGKQFGSTRRGIAPVYADKYMKKGIRFSDLLQPDTLEEKVRNIVDWKNLTYYNGYGAGPISADAMLTWLHIYGDGLKDYICDTTVYLNDAIKENKNILFEAQLGALRDIDYGIYPYTSSSSTIASYAPIGAGIPARKLDSCIGVMKAYSSCVGEGPFVVEMFGKEADMLRGEGQEFGAATGRPRRVGAFDCVASKYGCMIQGADEIALTKLDILNYMESIPVCVAYDIDGEITTDFPTGDRLERAKPVYKYMDGFGCDVSKARKLGDLSKSAIDYIKFIEESVGCPIKYVSVGAERDEYFEI